MSLDSSGRRITVRILCGAVVVLIGVIASLGSAGAQVQRPELMDTTRVDTTSAVRDTLGADTLRPRAAADTARRRGVFRQVGAPLGTVLSGAAESGTTVISKRDLVWQRYYTLFDVLTGYLPAYPLSQGGPGTVRAFSYAGAPDAGLGVTYNGRPLAAPGSGAYDLELYPTEFLERAEVLTGARAMVYGPGEALASVNLVQPRFTVDGSYVRLWYIQGPYSTTGADILYDRNIGERMDVSLGFRRLPSDGELPNSEVSNTAIHGALTWNPSRALSVSLSEIFQVANRGMSGGLTPTSSRTQSLMQVYDAQLGERSLRHDVTLSARWLPGARPADTPARRGDSVSAPLDPGALAGSRALDVGDTLMRVDASLYFTHGERNLVYGESVAVIDDVPRLGLLDQIGARAAAILPLPFATLEATGRMELWNGDLRLEAGGMLDIHTGRSATGGSLISLRPAVKLVNDGSATSLIALGEAEIRLSDVAALRGSLRNTVRLAEPVADCVPLTADGIHFFLQDRTAFLAEGGLSLGVDSTRLDAGVVLRRTEPTLCSPFPAATILSGDVRVQVPVSFLTLKVHGLATLPPEGDLRFPKLLADGELYAAFTLLRGNLDLRIGVTAEYQTSFAGAEYDPLSDDFIYPLTSERPTSSRYPLLGAYAVARLGSAYLRAEFRNLLDSEYWTLYRYPTWSRALYLGATWALFD